MNRYVNSFSFNGNDYYYCDLKKIFQDYPLLKKLPISLKILLESNIRNSRDEDLESLIKIFIENNNVKNINFYPNRILMQDYTGIPVLIDFAKMRDFIKSQGKDEKLINPKVMIDLVIDHSLNINSSSKFDSSVLNLEKEIKINKERYEFVKWAQSQFENLSIVPSGFGVSHQLNLEYLSTMIASKQIDEKIFIYPETLIGTDSHTTMINALGVLAWEVSGIDAQTVAIDSKISLKIPRTVGVEVVGNVKEGISANDIVLTLTNLLKEFNVSNKIVEFFGEGLKNLSLEDRATISNMAPEYGAFSTYFIVDDNTISYVEKTRNVDATLIKEYFKIQNMYDVKDGLIYDEYFKFDLSLIQAVVSGPKKPEDKVTLRKIPSKLESFKIGNLLRDNDIVLASITSCMSTSNPALIIQSALLAKKAISFGLEINTNIKKSFSPGSIVVKQYLQKLDLLKYFDELGFNITGFGCGVCCGNSGNLLPGIEDEIEKYNLNVSSVTSGNRNLQRRVHPSIKSNWLMSPALVLAYCFKGTINCNILDDEIAKRVYLKDIWPTNQEVNEYLQRIESKTFSSSYMSIFTGNREWIDLKYEESSLFKWDEDSTYIQPSNIFENSYLKNIEIRDARILAIFADKIDTSMICDLGEISPNSPAGIYLESKGIKAKEFNTYESRRGNAEVMMRGTFSNIHLENKIAFPKKGGYTRDFESDEIISIYDFSFKMKEKNTPLVVFAGENYGMGNLVDGATKGIKLLGIKVIIAKSFDNTHRLNLIKMGILPLEFIENDAESLDLVGDEIINIFTTELIPNAKINLEIKKAGQKRVITVKSRLESVAEVEYYKNGGVVSYMLKNISN